MKVVPWGEIPAMELSGGLFLLLMLGVCTTNRIPGKDCGIAEVGGEGEDVAGK